MRSARRLLATLLRHHARLTIREWAAIAIAAARRAGVEERDLIPLNRCLQDLIDADYDAHGDAALPHRLVDHHDRCARRRARPAARRRGSWRC